MQIYMTKKQNDEKTKKMNKNKKKQKKNMEVGQFLPDGASGFGRRLAFIL